MFDRKDKKQRISGVYVETILDHSVLKRTKKSSQGEDDTDDSMIYLTNENDIRLTDELGQKLYMERSDADATGY